jgi:hypothetical protein
VATYVTTRLNIEEVDLLSTLEIQADTTDAEYEDATRYKKVYPFKHQRSLKNTIVENPPP